MLRANSQLRGFLGSSRMVFLEYATRAIERILPHIEVTRWVEGPWGDTHCRWVSPQRTAIRVCIGVGPSQDSRARSITAEVQRRVVDSLATAQRQTLDRREFDLCKRISLRIDAILRSSFAHKDDASLAAIRNAFDEQVVSEHIAGHHGFALGFGSILSAMHGLAQETYENKALTFGCIIDPNLRLDAESVFPVSLLASKKYRSLSDGFRTAYHVSTGGAIADFVDLEAFAACSLTAGHYYPEWAENIAKCSREGRCGICLSRQGDILVFDEGTLRFTFRYGRWQYWNHAYLVSLLKDRARAQRVPPAIRGRVVKSIYRTALDVSFRRSGGLFVILRNRKKLLQIVHQADVLGHKSKSVAEQQFDTVLATHGRIQRLPRTVVVDIASLDGAVVIENSGRIRAYAAVLSPHKRGHLSGTEGSRTKAAIGASNYGLAVKVSSDGDITVYHAGKEFIRV